MSGFGYPTWRGEFYPAGSKPADFLRLYAERLPSVELNATGRRFPGVEQLDRWAEATPATFRFAVKLTSAVVMRPATAGRFCDVVRTLEARLGPVLVQLPALGRHDSELAEALFGALAPDLLYAVELKDDAWNAGAVRELAQGLSTTIVNAPTADDAFEYHRFRDPPYATSELEAIAGRVGRAVARGAAVYGYFKHEDEPTGPRYAAAVLDLIGPR